MLEKTGPTAVAIGLSRATTAMHAPRQAPSLTNIGPDRHLGAAHARASERPREQSDERSQR